MQFKTILLFLLGNFCLGILAADIDPNLIPKDRPLATLGEGAFGKAELTLYDESQMVVRKEIPNYLTRPVKYKIYNIFNIVEICANYELYASPFLSSAFGVYFDSYNGVIEKDTLNFAMEPMLGGTLLHLHHFLQQNPSLLSLDLVKLMLARIALGIDDMHKKGWAWLDASMRNIFIDHQTGYPRLGDFGLARLLNKAAEQKDWDGFADNIAKSLIGLLGDNFKQASKNLSESLKNKPSIEGVQSALIFQDFNWQGAKEGNLSMGFIPKDSAAYLKMVYGGNNDVIGRISRGEKALDASSMGGFVMGQTLLEEINKTLPRGAKKIKNAGDFCRIMLKEDIFPVTYPY